MYAVIETGGKQYSVMVGDSVFVEKLDKQDGENIEFDALLYSNEDDIRVGTPTVDGIKVKAKVVKQVKSKKIYVFMYKSKKDVRKKRGHRQPYTQLEITEIGSEAPQTTKTAKVAEAAE